MTPSNAKLHHPCLYLPAVPGRDCRSSTAKGCVLQSMASPRVHKADNAECCTAQILAWVTLISCWGAAGSPLDRIAMLSGGMTFSLPPAVTSGEHLNCSPACPFQSRANGTAMVALLGTLTSRASLKGSWHVACDAYTQESK